MFNIVNIILKQKPTSNVELIQTEMNIIIAITRSNINNTMTNNNNIEKRFTKLELPS